MKLYDNFLKNIDRLIFIMNGDKDAQFLLTPYSWKHLRLIIKPNPYLCGKQALRV